MKEKIRYGILIEDVNIKIKKTKSKQKINELRKRKQKLEQEQLELLAKLMNNIHRSYAELSYESKIMERSIYSSNELCYGYH